MASRQVFTTLVDVGQWKAEDSVLLQSEIKTYSAKLLDEIAEFQKKSSCFGGSENEYLQMYFVNQKRLCMEGYNSCIDFINNKITVNKLFETIKGLPYSFELSPVIRELIVVEDRYREKVSTCVNPQRNIKWWGNRCTITRTFK